MDPWMYVLIAFVALLIVGAILFVTFSDYDP